VSEQRFFWGVVGVVCTFHGVPGQTNQVGLVLFLTWPTPDQSEADTRERKVTVPIRTVHILSLYNLDEFCKGGTIYRGLVESNNSGTHFVQFIQPGC